MKKEILEDLALILYVVPFAASGIYSLFLWSQLEPISAFLPREVYLSVTKDPIVFLMGFLSVSGAVLLELAYSAPDARASLSFGISKRIRTLAYLTLLFSIFFAWSSTGYSGNVALTFITFINGRFALIFSFLLILFSYLWIHPIRVGLGQWLPLGASLVLFAISAPILYLLWRGGHPWEVASGGSLAILVIGLLVYSFGKRLARKARQETRP